MPRRNRVRGLRARITKSRLTASLTFEPLEVRRPLHAGHDGFVECSIPVSIETLPDVTLPNTPEEALPGQQGLPPAVEPLHALSSIPQLNSLPSAPVDIYLDFDGHFEAVWGTFSNITTPVYSIDSDQDSFSDSELQAIHDIWAQVSEDYAPFHVNVTTVEPPSFANKVAMRVSIGGEGSWLGDRAGGVGYIDSFTSSIANTVYVFSTNLQNNPKRVAEASSHEAGHSFGLDHQSRYDSNGVKIEEYYTGVNGKAPIMGNSYAATRGLWWNGTTSDGPTTMQDDMARISRTANGFGYRPDDHGNTAGSATQLTAVSSQFTANGVISRTTDTDYFRFETDGGQVTLSVTLPANNNLDVRLELRSANDQVIQFAAPTDNFGATLTTTLQAGNYRVAIKSQGEYGDVGQYTLTVAVPAPSIEGFVFDDADNDGIRDDGELGIPNATVFDDRNGNGIWDAQPQLLFTAANTPIGFGANSSAFGSIVISSMAGTILDLNVRLSISHPRASDVYAVLITPLGDSIALVSDTAGSGASFTGTVFDDQAATSIYAGTAPFTGRFRPLGQLAPLVGLSPNGQWRLLVGDSGGDNGGVLQDFALEITSSAPELQTTTDAQGKYAFAFAKAGTHQIRQIPLSGYDISNPIGGVHEIVLQSSSAFTEVNFANVSNVPVATPTIINRALFYDHSKFDEQTAGIDALDDLAIASDKQAYLAGSGLATFASISSYVRGLNGIMIDVLDLSSPLTLDDFQFRMGGDNNLDGWQPAPLPVAITVRAGAGAGGADRIELVWGDDAVKNRWLEVTFEGNDDRGGFNTNTKLLASDVFYFGSRIGDTGSGSEASATTTASDELAARANTGPNHGVISVYDFDRNGTVTAIDQLISRSNVGVLKKLDLPGAEGSPLVASAVASALAIADREPAVSPAAYFETVRQVGVPAGKTGIPAIELGTLSAKAASLIEAAPQIELASAIDFDLTALAVDEDLLEILLG